MNKNTNKTAIATGGVAAVGAIAVLALKTNINDISERLKVVETKVNNDRDPHDELDDAARTIRSLSRRIEYLEDILEESGIIKGGRGNRIGISNTLGDSLRQRRQEERPRKEWIDEDNTNYKRVSNNVFSRDSEQTNDISTTNSVNKPNDQKPKPRANVGPGELIEKSEQQLEEEIMSDIY